MNANTGHTVRSYPVCAVEAEKANYWYSVKLYEAGTWPSDTLEIFKYFFSNNLNRRERYSFEIAAGGKRATTVAIICMKVPK